MNLYRHRHALNPVVTSAEVMACKKKREAAEDAEGDGGYDKPPSRRSSFKPSVRSLSKKKTSMRSNRGHCGGIILSVHDCELAKIEKRDANPSVAHLSFLVSAYEPQVMARAVHMVDWRPFA